MAWVTLYVDENFSGTGLDLRSEVMNLAAFTDGLPPPFKFNWSDETSSIIVHEGTWQFFEHVGFAGASMILSPGHYPNMHDFPIHDNQLSSLKIISG